MPIVRTMGVGMAMVVRVVVAVAMPMTVVMPMPMMMMTKRSHSHQIHKSAQCADHKKLAKPLRLTAFDDSFARLEHDLHADQPARCQHLSNGPLQKQG